MKHIYIFDRVCYTICIGCAYYIMLVTLKYFNITLGLDYLGLWILIAVTALRLYVINNQEHEV
ncbi:MAG: hypothetical protein WC707_01460 [Candidatus Babeliaceae bacterium]